MNDVFIVVSEDRGARRNARCVLAGSAEDARQAHLANYPHEHIVAVRERR
jgi:hypothetical protein